MSKLDQVTEEFKQTEALEKHQEKVLELAEKILIAQVSAGAGSSVQMAVRAANDFCTYKMHCQNDFKKKKNELLKLQAELQK